MRKTRGSRALAALALLVESGVAYCLLWVRILLRTQPTSNVLISACAGGIDRVLYLDDGRWLYHRAGGHHLHRGGRHFCSPCAPHRALFPPSVTSKVLRRDEDID